MKILRKTVLFLLLGGAAAAVARFALFSGSGVAVAWSNGCFFSGLLLLLTGLFLYTLTLRFYDYAVFSFQKSREERRIRHGEQIDKKLPPFHEFLAERERKFPPPFQASLLSGAVLLALSLILAFLLP